MPACIDLAENPTEKYPMDGTLALVAGWGLSKARGYWAPSDILQSFEIPVVNFNECKEKAPWGFKNNVINDKVTKLQFTIRTLIELFLLVDLHWVCAQ